MPHSDHDGPLVKRQKTKAVVKRQVAPRHGSTIFAPFRVRNYALVVTIDRNKKKGMDAKIVRP